MRYQVNFLLPVKLQKISYFFGLCQKYSWPVKEVCDVFQAINGKRVAIKCPENTGLFYKYKRSFFQVFEIYRFIN